MMAGGRTQLRCLMMASWLSTNIKKQVHININGMRYNVSKSELEQDLAQAKREERKLVQELQLVRIQIAQIEIEISQAQERESRRV